MSRSTFDSLVRGMNIALVSGVVIAAGMEGTAFAGVAETPNGGLLNVITPDTKLGYVMREESWNGSLPVGDNIPIRQQLFKNNDYRFYVWTDVKGAKVSVHIYDQDGNLIDGRIAEKASGESHFAEVDVKPESTGSYYLIVKVEQSSAKLTAWQMACAYK